MLNEKLITYTKYFFRFILGGMLIFAGVLKMEDNSALFESVAYITWIPLTIKSLIVDLLPWVEVIVGGLMVLNLFTKIVIPFATIIYFIFFVYAVFGLGSGMEGDCGCFGDLDESSILGTLLGSEFGWKMVIRNGIFLLMAGFLFWDPKKSTD